MKKYVILISGRGSNMRALLDASLPGVCAGVISNRPGAPGLDFARDKGVATRVVDHKAFPDRDSFDRALMAEIDTLAPDLVVLAGFMRILTPAFVRHYQGRLVNIHPSLLPAFPGLDTHAAALAAGVRLHGATVHFVTPELDVGPALIQAAVPVRPDDTAQALAQRVLAQEHLIYPRAVSWLLAGQVRLEGNRVAFDLPAADLAGEALRFPGP
ncbi:phosphoribosylglycinamide formyltransferase [Denitratisoma sp. agr-D3]